MDDKKNERTPETDNEKSFYQPEDASSPALDEDTGNNSRSATGTKKTMPNSNIGIEWEAAEYVHHPKGVGWIAGLIATALLLVAFAVWLHAWTFVVLIIVMAVAFGIIAFRPPKLLHYKLDGQGITVSGQFYALSSFRAYGMLADGDLYTIMLVPIKRLMPSITVFFTEEQGEKIVDILSPRLPAEVIREDMAERLMKYLRF